MKKILCFLTVFILSCSGSDNITDNDLNPNSNHVNYEFTLKFNGQIFKVSGNTSDGFPVGYNYESCKIANKCYRTGNSLFLAINDASVNNYVSGQMFELQALFTNLFVGENLVVINLSGDFFLNFVQTNNLIKINQFVLSNQSISANELVNMYYTQSLNRIPINITNLGTPPNDIFCDGYLNFGNVFQGNYSGTIYFCSSVENNIYNFDFPVDFEINFKAVRED
jgi:hypothetical protein